MKLEIQNKRSLRSGLCVSKNAYLWHVETINILLKVKKIYRKYPTAAILNERIVKETLHICQMGRRHI